MISDVFVPQDETEAALNALDLRRRALRALSARI